MPIFFLQNKKFFRRDGEGPARSADKYELYKILKEEGLETFQPKKKQRSFSLSSLHISIGGKVKTQDKINFARNLGLMLKAGLALSRAASLLSSVSQRTRL